MILFFDIDGTLLDYDGRMPDSACEALSVAKEKGHKLILCSGRSKCAVKQLLERFGFDGVVCSAGAYVEYRGQIVHWKKLTKHEQRKLIGFCEQTQAVYGLQTRENIVCPSEMLEAYENSFGNQTDAASGVTDSIDKATHINDKSTESSEMSNDQEEKLDDISKTFIFVDDIRAVEEVEKAFYYGANVGLLEAEKILAPEFEVRAASYNMPDPNNGEISLKGITKSYGMQKLLDYLQAERSNTIAFGDGPNDFEMLEFAEIGVAMGNAEEALKEIADYVTSPVNEDGILNALRYFKLI